MKNKFMKQLRLHAVGDLRLDTVPVPKCAEDEVLLQVRCCGICGSDIGRIFKTGTYSFPTAPGHEFCGDIVFDPKNILTGKRAAVFPLLPCFECDMCKAEKYAQCDNYDYYGSRRDGAYAQYIAVKRFNTELLPNNVSYEEGAMCEPSAVALHAVKKLGEIENKNVLISGAGAIGLIVAQWAAHNNAKKVMLFDIDEEKTNFFKKLGFSEYDGSETDVALEGTGAGGALSKIINAVKPFGKIVLMGNPANPVTLSPKDYQMILRKEITLEGTWNSSYSVRQNDWTDALNAMSNGTLKLKELITHRVTLENTAQTLAMMRDKKEFYCKVMIVNGGEEDVKK